MSTREGFGEEPEEILKSDGKVDAKKKYDGPERRRTEFNHEADKHFYDAANLIRIAKEMSVKQGKDVDPCDLIKRKDDDVQTLKRAIYLQLQLYAYMASDADGRNSGK